MFKRNQNKNEDIKPTDDVKWVTGLPLAILFSAICINSVLIVLYMTVIGTAIPSITTYFGTVEDVDWYGTANMLALCAFQPITGQIYSIFRVKQTFVTFMSIFSLGTLVSALARTSKAFIVGRAIAGLGSAGTFNGSMVIITSAVAPALRAQFLSISVIMVGIGGVVGPVMGGAITQHLGWRWCFWVFLPPQAAVALVFVVQRIPDQVEKLPFLSVIRQIHHKLDFIGFTLFVPACVMFLLAMSWGGSKFAWDSVTTIALLCASVLAVGLFAGWMRYYKERAMIPPHILLNKVVSNGCCVSFLQGGAFLMLQYYLPLWFQSVKGASPEKSGVMMLPTCIAQIVAGVACTGLLRTIPYAPIWGVMGNVATAVGAGLMVTFSPSTSSGKWIGYQILNGIGRGIAMQMPILAAQGFLPPSEISYATANLLFFQYFGGAIINCVAKTVFINSLAPALEEFAPNVNAQTVIQAGATEVFKIVKPNDVNGVRSAYNKALTLTFWLPTACACAGALFSFGLGWHKVGKKNEKKAKETPDEESHVSVDNDEAEKPGQAPSQVRPMETQ